MYCLLLGGENYTKGALVDIAHTNWKKAQETFDNHF